MGGWYDGESSACHCPQRGNSEESNRVWHILIAMQVNKDYITIAQFKTYLSADGGNRRNFMT